MGISSMGKGACQGLFGLVSFPFTGILKAVHSVSTGIKNASGGGEILNGRFRYPRYFDHREIMKPYDKTMSQAYTAI